MNNNKFSMPSDEMFDTLDTVKNLYGGRQEVLSIELGLIHRDGLATGDVGLIIYVEEKLKENDLLTEEIFPKEIRGLRVDVIEEPAFIVDNVNKGSRKDRFDVIQPGISISSRYSTSGTLGLIVFDKRNNYQPCILSNWHVLARNYIRRTARAGSPVYQPGRLFGGRVKNNIVARFTRSSRSLDAAIATLTGGRDFITEQFESGVNPTTARLPVYGDIVEKSGARTKITRGKIISMTRNSFTIKPVDPDNTDDLELSDGGDSGAIWYDPDTKEAIGLHFAGDTSRHPSDEFSRAKILTHILSRLDISLTPK